MTNDKDIKTQINEYKKLIEELKIEEIVQLKKFIAHILIEKNTINLE
jgi:hypothetical protein